MSERIETARTTASEKSGGDEAWRVTAAWILMLVVLGGLVAFFIGVQIDRAGTVPGGLLVAARKASWAAERWLLDGLLLNPTVIVIIVAAFGLEFLIPADRRQRKLSPGLVNDLLWHAVTGVFRLTVMVAIYGAAASLFERHLGFLILDYARAWPAWAKVSAAILVADYLRWVTHFVRHKVPFMWRFHALHHGQRELNFFSNYRQHPLESVFAWAIRFVPFMVLHVEVELTALAIVAMTWFVNLYHANLRTNFGPLRYVLVTPQSHRVHHSPLPEHRDTNYGVLFSIWDRLHGTQFPDAGIYPETGIEDANFPVATGFAPGHQVATLARQLAYPFYRVVGAEGPILPAPD